MDVYFHASIYMCASCMTGFCACSKPYNWCVCKTIIIAIINPEIIIGGLPFSIQLIYQDSVYRPSILGFHSIDAILYCFPMQVIAAVILVHSHSVVILHYTLEPRSSPPGIAPHYIIRITFMFMIFYCGYFSYFFVYSHHCVPYLVILFYLTHS